MALDSLLHTAVNAHWPPLPKGKRSKRSKGHWPSLDTLPCIVYDRDVYDLAMALFMLSRGLTDAQPQPPLQHQQRPVQQEKPPVIQEPIIQHDPKSLVQAQPSAQQEKPPVIQEPIVQEKPPAQHDPKPMVPQPKVSYECSECGKAFTSYQALGGHKTRHRKPAASVDAGSAAAPSVAVSKTHRCSICGKEFETGQKLGGHKRLHYEGKSGSAPATTSSACGGLKRLLDLNQLPPLPEMGLVWDSFRPAFASAAMKRKAAAEEEVQSPLPLKKARIDVKSTDDFSRPS